MVDEVPWYLDDADVPDGERQGERLQKVLAQRAGERRTCEILISGRVTVNDEVAELGVGLILMLTWCVSMVFRLVSSLTSCISC